VGKVTVLDDKFLGRELLRSAVQRMIFCPYTGNVLDVRSAVLVDGTDAQPKSLGMFVMSGQAWALAKEAFLAEYGEDFTIYDGSVLFSGK
jgi:hypothetical protein